MDVRPHQHIGLSTVTYLFDGEIMHRDSLGTELPIRPGELNWMTAGRGPGDGVGRPSAPHPDRSQSRGAAALAAAGQLPDIAAVVTIGAPCDTRHVIRLLDRSLNRILHEGEARVRLGGESFVIRRAFVEDLRAQDQRHRIAHLDRPLLILHSPRDEVVSVESAGAIFQAARHPKSFVSLDTADHLLTRAANAEYAATMIAAWISRFIPVIDPISG